MKTEEIAEIFKENEISVTSPRIKIFKTLERSRPLSMSELYSKVKDDLDKASLYRTINIFERLEIVRKINVGWKYKVELSERFIGHHHHLSCNKCHSIIPINEKELESFITKISNKYEFVSDHHTLEIQGFCKGCWLKINK